MTKSKSYAATSVVSYKKLISFFSNAGTSESSFIFLPFTLFISSLFPTFYGLESPSTLLGRKISTQIPITVSKTLINKNLTVSSYEISLNSTRLFSACQKLYITSQQIPFFSTFFLQIIISIPSYVWSAEQFLRTF